MAAWVWVLAKPGITARPRPSMHLVDPVRRPGRAARPDRGDAAVLDQQVAGQLLAGVQQPRALDQQGAHARQPPPPPRGSTARQASALRLALAWISCWSTGRSRTPWA